MERIREELRRLNFKMYNEVNERRLMPLMITFFRKMPVLGIIVDNATSEIIFCTDKWIKEMGYEPSEVIGSKFFDFLHKEDYIATNDVWTESQGAIKKGEVFDYTNSKTDDSAFENRYKRKDGSYMRLSWSEEPNSNMGYTLSIAHEVK